MSEVTAFTLGISNVFLIKDTGKILIDTGTDVDSENYLKLFSEMGITPQEIDLIVISHGHSDHFAHAYELKMLTGAPVLCHKNAVHALQTGINPRVIPRNELGKNVLEMIKGRNKGKEPIIYKSIEPDLIVESIFDLRQYGVEGKVIHTPGHSDCSVSVLLDSGEAIVGDMIVSSPFSGETCIAYFANDEQALFENIQMLLKNAHTFYSGHGGPFTKEEILKLV
jgi:hydroxyacylglutathione hydrolase